MNVERLEIPILGNFGEIKMCVYPASNNAVLFEEEDAVDYGESRWQLQEGCTYEYGDYIRHYPKIRDNHSK